MKNLKNILKSAIISILAGSLNANAQDTLKTSQGYKILNEKNQIIKEIIKNHKYNNQNQLMEKIIITKLYKYPEYGHKKRKSYKKISEITAGLSKYNDKGQEIINILGYDFDADMKIDLGTGTLSEYQGDKKIKETTLYYFGENGVINERKTIFYKNKEQSENSSQEILGLQKLIAKELENKNNLK